MKIYIDYKNFIYFTISKKLNQRQIQWLEFLNKFNFQIIYKKGFENGRINTFNWRSDHFERKEKQNIQSILKKRENGNFIRTEYKLNIVL